MDNRRQEENGSREGAESGLGYTYAVPVRQQAESEGKESLFRLVQTEKYPLRNWENPRRMVERWGEREGRVQTFSGRIINLANVTSDDIDIEDIAHALHNINRFNGHTSKPYSVLSHSLCAAALMPEGKKMEGLLHDAAEAYIGDIITPIKELFPAICTYEDLLLGTILNKYDKNKECRVEEGVYIKSPLMLAVDKKLGKGEHHVLQPNSDISEPDHSVLVLMQSYWNATPIDFIERYEELLHNEE